MIVEIGTPVTHDDGLVAEIYELEWSEDRNVIAFTLSNLGDEIFVYFVDQDALHRVKIDFGGVESYPSRTLATRAAVVESFVFSPASDRMLVTYRPHFPANPTFLRIIDLATFEFRDLARWPETINDAHFLSEDEIVYLRSGVGLDLIGPLRRSDLEGEVPRSQTSFGGGYLAVYNLVTGVEEAPFSIDDPALIGHPALEPWKLDVAWSFGDIVVSSPEHLFVSSHSIRPRGCISHMDAASSQDLSFRVFVEFTLAEPRSACPTDIRQWRGAGRVVYANDASNTVISRRSGQQYDLNGQPYRRVHQLMDYVLERNTNRHLYLRTAFSSGAALFFSGVGNHTFEFLGCDVGQMSCRVIGVPTYNQSE